MAVVRSEFLYQPYYCEENVWHALHSPRVCEETNAYALFVFSASGGVPLWAQRAGQNDRPVVWDYHVVMVTESDTVRVWDLDHDGPFPQSLSTYLDDTFPGSQGWPPEFQSQFRLIDRAVFHTSFSSDRSHMRDRTGAFLHPPPEWDAIVLPTPRDWRSIVDPDDDSWGQALERDGLERRFGAPISKEEDEI